MSTSSPLTAQQQQAAATLAPEAARQNALARPLTQVGLSAVYRVASGWEVAELARASHVQRIDTPAELAQALATQDTRSLLVTAAACPSLESLKPLLMAAISPRTVFFEQSA